MEPLPVARVCTAALKLVELRVACLEEALVLDERVQRLRPVLVVFGQVDPLNLPPQADLIIRPRVRAVTRTSVLTVVFAIRILYFPMLELVLSGTH